MNKASILLALNENLNGAVVRSEDHIDEMATIVVKRERVYEVLKFLKEHEEFKFNFLTTLCGVHFPDNKGQELSMMYQLHSWTNNVRLRIKTFFPIADPVMPTITPLWPAANWQERETYDFFGIIFTDHPDLRRILNVDDMDVFPMRKEYALEDGTRTDKVDGFFGRDGNQTQTFD